MSKRNSAEAKRAARERLRAERARQERRRKIIRQLLVAAAVIVVLAAAAGIGTFIAHRDDGKDNTDWGAVRDQVESGEEGEYPTAPPANTTGDDHLTVRIGDEDAPNTLTLYEDPRCPACAAFEQASGEAVQEGVADGSYNVEYVFGTFLDGNLGGTGSKNALNALGAALNVSPEAFVAYHDALYSAEHHPDERHDDFADDRNLIDIAQSVPELKDNQEFIDAVNNSTFAVWALQMSDKFQADEEVTGTPTLKFNGEIVDTPRTADDFRALVEEHAQSE